MDKKKRKLITTIPTIVFELGLTSKQLALYVVLSSFSGNSLGEDPEETLAKHAGLEKNEVAALLEDLKKEYEILNDSLIFVSEDNVITVNDLWYVSAKYFERNFPCLTESKMI